MQPNEVNKGYWNTSCDATTVDLITEVITGSLADG